MFGSISAASIAVFAIFSMTSMSFDTTKILVESQPAQAALSVAVPAYSSKDDVAMCQYATQDICLANCPSAMCGECSDYSWKCIPLNRSISN